MNYRNKLWCAKEEVKDLERLLEEALFRLDISNFVNSNAPCEIIGLTMRCQVEKIQTYQ